MHTGEQFTSPQPPTPGPGGGRGGALLIGGIAFAIVFLLIVGATVGYLVLRPTLLGGGGDETTAATSETAEDPEDTASDDATAEEPTGEASTTVVEERCWSPAYERTSKNPSGKLRGGGLEFIPPAAYTGRESEGFVYFLNDTQTAYGKVEEGWISTMTVGEVEWQPGVEYPGNEVASQKIAKCFFTDGNWGEKARERTWDDETTKPVTIAGMPGYETRAVVNFGSDDLEKTDATEIVVVVLDTDQGPSAFVTDTAVGVTEHEEAVEKAYASVTGLSG
ncbi:hypothetical protein BH708_17880 [Brachybacterium sp. P6-10-X1]|uniref:hypothetical protein n=1 Tax=Brachybacterium sp. P6-10-X1 TaxID=1903186 RepID=UPI000971AD2E|nr:hypothetical protein [Brachybacterium sp. P6-10-X1]APX34264.1 hypothetical protein BH708_17880 [Brachybacterium sp. P6-10-X1]